MKQLQVESDMGDFTLGLLNPNLSGDIPHVQQAVSVPAPESPGDVRVRKLQDVLDKDEHCRNKLSPRGMLTPSSPSLPNPTCGWEQDGFLAIPAKACWQGHRVLLVPVPDIT